MRIQRLLIGLTVINLGLLMFLLTQTRSVEAQDVAPVLRGRALEIVDGQGRVRSGLRQGSPEAAEATIPLCGPIIQFPSQPQVQGEAWRKFDVVLNKAVEHQVAGILLNPGVGGCRAPHACNVAASAAVAPARTPGARRRHWIAARSPHQEVRE